MVIRDPKPVAIARRISKKILGAQWVKGQPEVLLPELTEATEQILEAESIYFWKVTYLGQPKFEIFPHSISPEVVTLIKLRISDAQYQSQLSIHWMGVTLSTVSLALCLYFARSNLILLLLERITISFLGLVLVQILALYAYSSIYKDGLFSSFKTPFKTGIKLGLYLGLSLVSLSLSIGQNIYSSALPIPCFAVAPILSIIGLRLIWSRCILLITNED